MKCTKIITHDGFFHADEVFATALLLEVLGEVPVERTRTISTEDMKNPDIWVLDVGKVLDPECNNYDHHQLSELNSTNVQVLSILFARGEISIDLFNELNSAFNAISDIDRNGYDNFNGFQVNGLIRSLNHTSDGWTLAINVARAYVRSCINTLEECTKSREIWDRGEFICFGVKMCDAFPIHWKRYNEAPFLITPDGNTWKLHSINSNLFPLVPTGKELFMHTNKFLAIYNSKDDAWEAGQAQALNTFG